MNGTRWPIERKLWREPKEELERILPKPLQGPYISPELPRARAAWVRKEWVKGLSDEQLMAFIQMKLAPPKGLEPGPFRTVRRMALEGAASWVEGWTRGVTA